MLGRSWRPREEAIVFNFATFLSWFEIHCYRSRRMFAETHFASTLVWGKLFGLAIVLVTSGSPALPGVSRGEGH